MNSDPAKDPVEGNDAPSEAARPTFGAEADPVSPATEFDTAVPPSDLELAQPVLDLARITTKAAHQLVDTQHQTLANLAQLGHTVQDGRQKLARAAADMAAGPDAWRRLQQQSLERAHQARDAITSLIGGVWSSIKRGAAAAGEAFETFYLRCAPPNWTTDPTAAVVDYVSAARLALNEGIPLAWVPDQETVRLLLAVPDGDDRRAQLHQILEDRRVIILAFCDARLDQITDDSAVQAVAIARESVEALRLGLTAPAQSAATNLVDRLLWETFRTVHGHYTHNSARQRVEELSRLIDWKGMRFLGTLRELATMMPVVAAFTPWWPNSDVPPPTTFSRHVTTHHIATPGQVNPVNALIAVMLAVSLLSQRHNSGWASLITLRVLDAQDSAPSLAQAQSVID